MQLVRVLYVSRETDRMTPATFRELASTSHARNTADGITGLLCYAPPYFVQCLEGPRTAVSRALARIYRDPRHGDITLISCRDADDRLFGGWAMRMAHLNDLPLDRVRRLYEDYGGAPFRPDLLSEEQLLGFLQELPAALQLAAAALGVTSG